jgi:alpha-tubulin suppressor-like RCC1 family protein
VPLVNDTPTPVDSSNGWAHVAAGAFHSCGRKERNSELFCWGRAGSGQLGVGGNPDVVESPTRVAIIGAVRRVGTGAQHSCALDADNQLYCWGDNTQGQLGVTDPQRRDEPILVAQ